jgi:hypothetical protein
VSLFNVGVVRAIDRAESAVASDAALKFCRHFLNRGFFEGIGATAAEKGGAHEKENDR